MLAVCLALFGGVFALRMSDANVDNAEATLFLGQSRCWPSDSASAADSEVR